MCSMSKCNLVNVTEALLLISTIDYAVFSIKHMSISICGAVMHMTAQCNVDACTGNCVT